jgi:DNA-binding transcriptional ArsR family regulator
MTEQRNLTTSDPVTIRALTHPVRLELLDVLREGPATATECAEATGESVASCSFHLRTLAKYGFIEPAERRGREKPWQLTSDRQDFRPAEDPDSVRAVGAMAEVYVNRAFGNLRLWLSRLTEEPRDWQQASFVNGSSFWATADEVAELGPALEKLTSGFEGRQEDPSQRPDGARPVRLLAIAHPDIAREKRRVGGQT